ncbi:MAG: Regulatory protein RecX [Pseudomonadota bacterium]|jgi:regulatory protein
MTTLRERALRLLAKSEQSREGLARKLARHGSEEDIHLLLESLQQSGLLSDERYAEGFIAARTSRYGAARIRQALRGRGVDDDVINAHLIPDAATEYATARALWVRKFGTPPADAREYARQVRFLASRGFSGEVIRKILKEHSEYGES